MNPAQMSASSAADDDADRDAWCTALRMARAIGPVDYDPCSNERSNILATHAYMLSRGQDALVMAKYISRRWLGFINPPYSRGMVMRFVLAFVHHRFIFLLRFDPSTEWFALLYEMTERIAFPKDRTDFEPPPGVEAKPGNPFPHALFYARAEDVSDAIHASCYVVDTGNRNRRS